MITRIHCNGCGKSGVLFIRMEFTTRMQVCNLHHFHEQSTSYHFCTLDCLKRWQDYHEVFEQGIPCPSCIDYSTGKPTGFLCGFEQNGPCRLCNGEKRVQEMKREDESISNT